MVLDFQGVRDWGLGVALKSPGAKKKSLHMQTIKETTINFKKHCLWIIVLKSTSEYPLDLLILL